MTAFPDIAAQEAARLWALSPTPAGRPETKTLWVSTDVETLLRSVTRRAMADLALSPDPLTLELAWLCLGLTIVRNEYLPPRTLFASVDVAPALHDLFNRHRETAQ